MRTSYFTSFALASFLAVVQGIELRSADGLGATSAFQDQYAVDGLAQISDKERDLREQQINNRWNVKKSPEVIQKGYGRYAVTSIVRDKKEKRELSEPERKMKELSDDFSKKEEEERYEEWKAGWREQEEKEEAYKKAYDKSLSDEYNYLKQQMIDRKQNQKDLKELEQMLDDQSQKKEDREKKLEENKKKNMIKFKKRVPKKDM